MTLVSPGFTPAVEAHELRKEFRRKPKSAGRFARARRVPALKGVTFTIARGECVAVLGRNGSGKSTLVRLLSTLLLHDGGTARIFGHDAFANPRAVRRLVNRVSVEASFFKRMSPEENLAYAARFYGMTPATTRGTKPASAVERAKRRSVGSLRARASQPAARSAPKAQA